jgi:hypothetical protein
MKIKLSKSQWKFIGQQAGWMKTAQQEPDASNPYMGSEGYRRWGEDSANISLSILEPNQKHGSFMGSAFYKGGVELVQNGLMEWLQSNLPYEQNGAVSITIRLAENIGKDTEHKTVWKTHPLHFKKISVREIFDVVHQLIQQANALNREYNEFTAWNNMLEDAKERRKSGYYDQYPSKSPEEKSRERHLKKEDEREHRQIVQDYLTKETPINNPFANMNLKT